MGGRIYGELTDQHDAQRVASQLAHIFGIRWYAPASRTAPSYDAIEKTALDYARAQYDAGARTFKLEAKRRNKQFPLSSYELCCRVGDAIRAEMPAFTARLDAPEALFNIDIAREHALVYGSKQNGLGGLPVGTTGRALALLSGGIDSPVAAWQLMRRGLELDYVYFASPPFTGSRAEQKVRDIASVLAAYSPRPPQLFVSRFTEIQEQIAQSIQQPFWTVCHRRFMQRIAGELARSNGCEALASGDALGQVASQTLRNMKAIDDASDDLILRPLLGMDKQDIVREARKIGSYEISIRPFEDCCVLFAPKRPATAVKAEAVNREEAELDIGALVERAVAQTSVHEVHPRAIAQPHAATAGR